jgi:hypothetical protein
LIDVDAARDNAASSDFTTAFVVGFAGAAQVSEQRAASVLVGPDVLIDTLVADVDLVRLRQPVTDLLRTPLLMPQLGLDQRHHPGRHLVRDTVGNRPARHGGFMGRPAGIAAAAPVASQLAADRRLASANLCRNLRLVSPA